MRKLRGYLEYGVYFYIIVFVSPFMFLVSLNEIAAFETGSGFKAVSFVFSLLSFLLLIVIAFLPMVSLLMKKTEKNFFSGLRDSWAAKIFYTTVMVKFLAFSIIFILINQKEVQLSFFLLVIFLSCTYLVKIRPFDIPMSNIIAIMNEGMLFFIGLLMILFLESSLNHDSLSKFIIYTLSANIIICFGLAIVSQLYSLLKKKQKKNMVNPNEIIRDKINLSKTPKATFQNNQLEISNTFANLIYIGNFEESKEDKLDQNSGKFHINYFLLTIY